MISAEMREEFTSLLQAHVIGLDIKGDQANGHVPWREDNHPSFSADLNKGVWYDKARGEGGGLKDFKARLGLNGNGKPKAKIVATYDYYDEARMLLYQVVRYDSKEFRQRRPDGKGGWLEGPGCMKGVRRVLYHLPQLLMADTVYVVEGEKDADRLWSLGLPATTNPQGAGKWREEYNRYLAGKRVVILPDNDEAGEAHAWQVARSLLLVASSVKLIPLPGLLPKGDVSDWLDQGHAKEELTALIEKTPVLRLEDFPQEQKRTGDGLQLTRLGDLLNEPEELLAWLVDRVLPAGGFSLLVGKPKSGKSTLARVLALAVALAREFLSKTTTQGPVIYLALEEKRSEVKKHFRDMGASGEEDVYIYAASAPADALQQIRTEVEEKKPVLLIIDPLFKLARIKDGNDYVQVTQALEPLLVLARETGTHVLCVHHAGKGEREGGDSILGSTAIFAAVDTALLLKRSERYRTISSIQRYGEDLPETVLHFDPQTRTISLGDSKEQEEENRLGTAIVEFLRAKEEPVTEVEIDNEVEGRRAVRKRALRLLVAEGRVERTGKGGKGDPYRYTAQNTGSANTDSGSPYIYGNQGTTNTKNGLSPQEPPPYSGSQVPYLFDDPREDREPESTPWEDEI